MRVCETYRDFLNASSISSRSQLSETLHSSSCCSVGASDLNATPPFDFPFPFDTGLFKRMSCFNIKRIYIYIYTYMEGMASPSTLPDDFGLNGTDFRASKGEVNRLFFKKKKKKKNLDIQ